MINILFNIVSLPQYDGGDDFGITEEEKVSPIWKKRLIGEHNTDLNVQIVILDVNYQTNQLLGIRFEDEFEKVYTPQHYHMDMFKKTSSFFEGSWNYIYSIKVCLCLC